MSKVDEASIFFVKIGTSEIIAVFLTKPLSSSLLTSALKRRIFSTPEPEEGMTPLMITTIVSHCETPADLNY